MRARDKVGMIGHYTFKQIRDGVEIDAWEIDNLVVNQGLNDMLSVYFNAGAQKTSWFMSLFQGNYAPVLTDTAATWSAAATECTGITSPTRPAYTPAAPAAQTITNSATPTSFTFNANNTLYGIALASSNVLGGTGGVLFSEVAFAAPKTVQTGDQLLITYSLTMTG
jgi:hypothetical protein